MEDKYFKWISDGYYKSGGVLYAPKEVASQIAKDGEEVKYNNLEFTLNDGIYMPYHSAVGGANLVDEELKKIIEKYVPKDYPIEFLPVKAKSEKYGEKQYYIMHFKKIFDVLDRDNCVYNTFLPKEDSSIIIPCLNSNKLAGLHIFNTRKNINDIIISDELRKKIKKSKLDIGIEFYRIKCT
jgi:hypothetical protein